MQTIDSLESRRLFSSAGIKSGVLNIRGDTLTPNTIVVSLANPTQVGVVINGGAQSLFNISAFGTAAIRGGISNDTITISGNIGRLFRVWTYGAADSVTVENVNTLIRLGRGDDSVVGGTGKDRVWGGEGADNLAGGGGNDFIHGWLGTDNIDGGDGDDLIFAGEGADTITGGAGANGLIGGGGSDLYNLGAGANTVFAIRGLNTINVNGGIDRIFTNADSVVNNATDNTMIRRNLRRDDGNGEEGA